MKDLQRKYDFIVIGAGMAGLSCASSLAKNGIKNVLIIESINVAHDKSSSFGDSRMFREMYSDTKLCLLSKFANKLWREEEFLSQRKLLNHHGLLFYGESWGEETIEGSISGAKKVMNEQKIPYEELNSKEILEKFPIIPRDHFTGLFEPMAGSINCNEAIEIWLGLALNNGHTLIENRKVIDINTTDGFVKLDDETVVFTDQIILTAGMWTNDFLEKEGIKIKLKAWPMLWGHYEVEQKYADNYPQWFCFQKSNGIDGGLYYGFPVLTKSKEGNPLIKVGLDWTLPEMILDNPEEFPENVPEILLEHLDNFVYKNIKGIIKRNDYSLSPYSMTRDVNFILDRINSKLTLFCGGSGQAFKFAPLIGHCLAKISTNNSLDIDISCWSSKRYSLSNY